MHSEVQAFVCFTVIKSIEKMCFLKKALRNYEIKMVTNYYIFNGVAAMSELFQHLCASVSVKLR